MSNTPVSPTLPGIADRPLPRLDVDLPDGIALSTTRTALWQGFTVSWRKDPHRLTHVASEVGEFTDINGGGRQGVRFRHRQALAVGDFPDQGDVLTFVTRIGSPDLRIVHGSATTRLSGPIGQALRSTGAPISVSLPFPTGTATVAAAILRGFSIDVVSRPDGYTARGFGVGVTAENLDGRTFRFRPTYFVRVDNNPDRPAQADGADVVYDVALHYSVLAAPLGKAAFTATAPEPISFTDAAVGPTPLVHVAAGQSGGSFAHAAFGVRGFEWELDEVNPLGLDGRYIRLVHSYVSTSSYAPQAGEASCNVVRWFSNEGLASLAFDCTARIDLLLVQLAAGAAPASGVLHGAVGATSSELSTLVTL